MKAWSISPLWAALLPAGALLASAWRWLAQASGNVWSKWSLHVYVPDPVLGWRRTADGLPWIGLDLLGALAAALAAVVVAALWVRRRETARGELAPRLRVALEIAAAVPMCVPIWAFTGGAIPDGAREHRPEGAIAVTAGGIEGSLDGLPAGRYQVIAHPDAAVAAKLVAGGEAFEARFSGDLEGFWVADPADLSQPMQAQVSVAAASVATGIDLRNEHARGDLKVEEHPRIAFSLTGLRAAEPRGAGEIAFEADGRVELVGRTHDVAATGTLRRVTDELRARFELSGERPAILVQASLSLNLEDTAIGNDGTFDTSDVPVHITLFLEHTETP